MMSSPSPNDRRLRFGLVASATTAHDSLATGLTATLGQPCDLVPSGSYRALVEALREKQVDLAWLPPLAYLRAEDVGAAHLVTTMERGGSPTFGCAFLGREGQVDSMRDLVGKRVAWTDPWSASGYVVPRTL